MIYAIFCTEINYKKELRIQFIAGGREGGSAHSARLSLALTRSLTRSLSLPRSRLSVRVSHALLLHPRRLLLHLVDEVPCRSRYERALSFPLLSKCVSERERHVRPRRCQPRGRVWECWRQDIGGASGLHDDRGRQGASEGGREGRVSERGPGALKGERSGRRVPFSGGGGPQVAPGAAGGQTSS